MADFREIHGEHHIHSGSEDDVAWITCDDCNTILCLEIDPCICDEDAVMLMCSVHGKFALNK